MSRTKSTPRPHVYVARDVSLHPDARRERNPVRLRRHFQGRARTPAKRPDRRGTRRATGSPDDVVVATPAPGQRLRCESEAWRESREEVWTPDGRPQGPEGRNPRTQSKSQKLHEPRAVRLGAKVRRGPQLEDQREGRTPSKRVQRERGRLPAVQDALAKTQAIISRRDRPRLGPSRDPEVIERWTRREETLSTCGGPGGGRERSRDALPPRGRSRPRGSPRRRATGLTNRTSRRSRSWPRTKPSGSRSPWKGLNGRA